LPINKAVDYPAFLVISAINPAIKHIRVLCSIAP